MNLYELKTEKIKSFKIRKKNSHSKPEVTLVGFHATWYMYNVLGLFYPDRQTLRFIMHTATCMIIMVCDVQIII